MNVDFVLAVSFGIGIAGLMGLVRVSGSGALVSRLTPIPLSFRRVRRKSLLGSGKTLVKNLRFLNYQKLERVLFELPEIIELITVCLRAGDGIYRSFSRVIPRCEGQLAREISKSLKAVDLGAAFGVEIRQVAEVLPHPQVSEFVNKVSLALERGTPLAQMLSEQGLSVREEIKNRLLEQAGKNETRMLIPLVFLILPVTVLFAIYPSLELLNFGFI